jgi:glycosyltransferase involved in cell wall biosynthesis
MRTLVLLENDLANDTRMRRHTRTLAELGQQVSVISPPYAGTTPGAQAEGVELIHWHCPELTLRADVLQRLAEETDLTDLVLEAFPGALAPGSFEELGPLSSDVQARQLAASRWDPFRNAVCEDGADPQADYRGLARLFEVMLQWAAFTCRHRADCVYAVDLPTLLAGVAHKRKFGSRLVFDAHEIFYDMAPGLYPRLWKQSLALLEWHLAPQADWVLGVSKSHVDWMRRTYDLPAGRTLCVPNCFAMGGHVPPPPPREPADPLRVYYHGASDPYRGLDTITRAVALVPGTCLVLRCPPSPTLEGVARLAAELGIADRVRILPLVPPDQMIEAVRAEADVGIHVTCDQPVALNLRVALTNKFIEYLVAGIPVVTAPLEEQARIVREYEAGYVLADNSVEAIRQGLLWLKANRARLPGMARRAHQAGVANFSWPTIRKELLRAVSADGPEGRAGDEGRQPDAAGTWHGAGREAFLRCARQADLARELDRTVANLRRWNADLDAEAWRLRRREAEVKVLCDDIYSVPAVSKYLVKLALRRLLRVPWRALPAPVRARLRPTLSRVLGGG